MRNIKLLASIVAVLAMIVSCDKPALVAPNENQEQNDNKDESANTNGGAEGEGESTKLKGVTLTIEEINTTNVYFTGEAKQMTPDIVVGIYWDYAPIEHISETHIKSTTDFYDGKFVLYVGGLPSNSTIYYMPYVHRNGVTEYGDCLSFKTAKPTMTVDNVEVYDSYAIFTGIAELEDGRGGILCSTEKNISLENYMTMLNPDTRYSEDYSYTHILSDLQKYTTYYYRTYYWDGGLDDYVYGEVESFSTGVHPYVSEAIKDLSLTSAEDLSAQGTSNCYIVSKPGLYKLKAVKGNDSNQILSNASQPAIIWESFGTYVEPDFFDLISSVCFKDGYLIFQTAPTFKEGNSVIAVKDNYGTILWSWHIWMTDKPQEYVYKNDAGTMMDRNLGATSATPGDDGTSGLIYQWGRKDPFLGFAWEPDEYYGNGTKVKSTIVWELPVESNISTGSIEYVTAHPTTFVTVNNNIDWYYSAASNTDTARWTTSETTKSIYDPCPWGWRVPDGGSGGVWAKAGLVKHDYYTDFLNNGTVETDDGEIYFNISYPSRTWYPTAGYRRSSDGVFSNYDGHGYDGMYWSASPSNEGKYYRLSISNNYGGDIYHSRVYPISESSAGNGYSVRCQKESR